MERMMDFEADDHVWIYDTYEAHRTAGCTPSVGSTGDLYENALAESVIGLYKTELMHRKGPWRALDDLELSTLEWVGWYNHRRIHSSIGNVTPVEYENAFYSGRMLTGTQ
jgi:putative transposase